MIASMGGFRLGVKSVRPDAEVKIIYLQSMEDPAAAKEATFSLIAGGADVIGGKLNAGQAGIIQAAKEKNVFATGRSVGHTAIAPESVLTNIDEKWGDIYAAAVTDSAPASSAATTLHTATTRRPVAPISATRPTAPSTPWFRDGRRRAGRGQKEDRVRRSQDQAHEGRRARRRLSPSRP